MNVLISCLFAFLAGAFVLCAGIECGWHLHKHFAPRRTVWRNKAFAVSQRRNEAAAVRPGIRSRFEAPDPVETEVFSALLNLGYSDEHVAYVLDVAKGDLRRSGGAMQFEPLFQAAMAHMPKRTVNIESLKD
jgi:hypothetical protein